MSFNTLNTKRLSNAPRAANEIYETRTVTPWSRPADWLTLPTVLPTDQKFVGLYAVWPNNGSFIGVSANGDYTVDWGDGTVENFASASVASHTYSYSNPALNGTECTRGYKQAIVTITPQAGQNLTRVDLHQRHATQTNMPATYTSNFLDFSIASAFLTELRVATSLAGNVRFPLLEQANIVRSNLKSCDGLFYSCPNFRSVVNFETSLEPVTTINCTLQDATDTVTYASHGLPNGRVIIFDSISGTSGITVGFPYYVINATTDTFQLTEWEGGSVKTLTTDGSGVIVLGTSMKDTFYSCPALVSMPAFTADNVTVMYQTFGACYSLTNVAPITAPQCRSFYWTFWSCLRILTPPITTAPNGIDFSTMYGYTQIQHFPGIPVTKGLFFNGMFTNCCALVKVGPIDTSQAITFNAMFSNCVSLESAPILKTSTVTTFSSMFSSTLIKSLPAYDTSAGTNFSSMFSGCTMLREAPLLNTAAGTNFSSMFSGCTALRKVPLLNTSNGTDFTSMFFNCKSLIQIPQLNTGNGLNFTTMFSGCNYLRELPLLDTSKGTNFTQFLESCRSLTTIPALNLSAGTNFTSMFSGCATIQSFPSFSTGEGLTFTSMFANCTSLKAAPALVLSKATTVASIFSGCGAMETVPTYDVALCATFTSVFSNCYSLHTVGAWNLTSGTTFSSMFQNCTNLRSCSVYGAKYAISFSSCSLSESEIHTIIGNLGRANTQGLSLSFSTNWGLGVQYGVSTSGGSAGSKTVNCFDTTGLAVGMQITGTNSPSTTAAAVTFQDAANTVTRTNHGLQNNDEISFATITTTTGIAINTIYYVINTAANTFQISLTQGGAAIDLVTDGSGTVRYKAEIESIVPNTSITLTRPMVGSVTSPTFRTLKTNTALLKGWAVTATP